jgi:hypothetical protein
VTDEEARKIAQHCIDAWPNGPKAYIWREVVIDLDYGTAVGAYKALVKKPFKTLVTVGAFKAEYDNLNHQHTDARGIRWTGNEISLDDYLKRIQARADMGNQDAADELANWRKWLAGKERTR